MIQENASPAVMTMSPPISDEDAAKRIAEAANNEALIGWVFANIDQFRRGMTESGQNTAVKLKHESPSGLAKLHVAESTGRDGSKWEFLVWSFGEYRSQVVMARQTKKADDPLPEETPKQRTDIPAAFLT